jgi:hypothetical protein
MHVAIVGSRDFNDESLIKAIIHKLGLQYGTSLTIVSGGARGADTLAENEAKRRGFDTLIFPADWAKHGKSAGFLRNAQIVEAADMVIALFAPGPKSNGTSNTVAAALGQRRPLHIYHEGRWS